MCGKVIINAEADLLVNVINAGGDTDTRGRTLLQTVGKTLDFLLFQAFEKLRSKDDPAIGGLCES